MLIKFTVNNFLSFNDQEEFNMEAGKARRYTERIYNGKNTKLTKCKVVLGANASGKSNLIEAFRFMQYIICVGIPKGVTNNYFRQNIINKDIISKFEIEILCEGKIFCYGFTILLNAGKIQKEWLFEKLVSGAQKTLFERNTSEEQFNVGDFFKNKNSILKLNNYGEDIAGDFEVLFLTIINKNKVNMFKNFPELQAISLVYDWFDKQLDINLPYSYLHDFSYITDSNIDDIAEVLNALGTGISNLQIVEVPLELVKSKIPEETYRNIILDLEKINTRSKEEKKGRTTTGIVKGYKEFYSFEIDENDVITVRTIEFSHENKSVYFSLREESDGTARLLDLIEIFFRIYDGKVFILDEIDRCLHPSMTVKVVELFLKLAEKRNAQLIITCHESRLLAAEILRNDEICFVLKNDSGATIINPLEKYQLRADKKVYAALFDGTLNAIPKFNENKLNNLMVNKFKY